MSVSNKNFKSVILFHKPDFSFLNDLKLESNIDLIEYEKRDEYLSAQSGIDLIIAFKPDKLLSIEDVLKDFNCTLIIEEKDKVHALNMIEIGLFDFYILEKDNPADLNFQIRKWETSIKIRDRKLNKILKNDKEINIQFQELEAKTKQSKKELNEAIDELESFSYSVSHDLRAPLRAITGFSGILSDEYQDKLNDEGKRYLDIIQKGTHQMSNLIDELLSFSRVGRLELRKTLFDPTGMVKDIVVDVKKEYEKEFKVTVAQLEPIFGDAITIKQVFLNLIRNAFKFSEKVDRPTIKIGSELVDNGCQYYVIDNGIGFDMRYVDKLFKVFQRLHSNTQFEGTGVGLAIVDRILKKHGGRIIGESPEEGGAEFYFWLPCK